MAEGQQHPLDLLDLTPGYPSTRRPIPQIEPSLQGTLALRTEIADHLRHARGVRCEAKDIVVTAGTSEALALVVLALRDYSAGPGAEDAPAGLVFGYAGVSDTALMRALDHIRAVTAADSVPG